MKGRYGRAYRYGFTLVEQLLVTLIVATITCLAVPAMGQLVRRSRLQVAQANVMAALQATRGLAISSGQRAMICPSRDGLSCSKEVHWEGGWLVGRYRTDRADQLDGAPTLVASDSPQLTIVSTAGRRAVRFQADGSAGGNNVSFTLCPAGRVDGALYVTVSNAGRIRGAQATAEQAKRCANGD
ncbi:GspH/FimT family pseudopilin [Dyella sp. 20L07]|uniref:GspH/FimT family pseudopilin n=1 Tax=Dyella sp. 20L07 TaxID=3384240 RepID=UPI003D2BFF27